MKFQIDHDLHIHSELSSCSSHPLQTPENILKYGIDNGLKTLCITDHHWDSSVEGMSAWYKKQGDIFSALPLPQSEKCRFLFGCETDMDKNFRIGLSKDEMDKMDFFIVPTTHLHMKGFTIAEENDNIEDKIPLYIKRFEAFLDADLPFEKVGLAHITCSLIHRDEPDGFIKVLDGVSDKAFETLFAGCAKRGCGVELNIGIGFLKGYKYLENVLRPYRIAKAQGCKFYLGSDAHSPEGLEGARVRFEQMIDLLDLKEEDKFII